MLRSFINQDIANTFTGTLLAIFTAGIVWVFKSAYEKHRSEVLALARLERMFVVDIQLLKDNFEYVGKWIEAIDNSRPYSFHVEKYFISDEETYKLSNLELISRILTINYKLRRTQADLLNIYDSYWKIIEKINEISDETNRNKNLQVYHENIKQILESFGTNHVPLEKDIIEVVGFIRAASKARKHSLFGYVSFLFRDIFPRVTRKSIERECDKFRKKLNKNKEID